MNMDEHGHKPEKWTRISRESERPSLISVFDPCLQFWFSSVAPVLVYIRGSGSAMKKRIATDAHGWNTDKNRKKTVQAENRSGLLP
jgi:hypothetical protein